LALNLKTEDAVFPLRKGGERNPTATLIVNGSFITEVHVVARVSGAYNKTATASFWAAELNENNWGDSVVNGTCGGRRFILGKGRHRTCGEFSVTISMSSAIFTVGNWTASVRGLPTEATSGPAHRLDVAFTLKGDYVARHLPHGILGQSFTTDEPRWGKTDSYPIEGSFTTKAMAEGAIEGTAAMYEVTSPFGTDFAFSRFHARQLPGGLGAGGGAISASGTDSR